MRKEFKIIVGLYVLVLVIVFALIGVLVTLSATSKNDVTWVEPIVGSVLDLAKVIVGAVVGALSTATAFMFSSRES